MDFEYSAKTRDLQKRVLAFMDDHIYPAEADYKELLRAFPSLLPAHGDQTQSLAIELGVHGITVNTIAPGIIETEIGGDFDLTKELSRAIARSSFPSAAAGLA